MRKEWFRLPVLGILFLFPALLAAQAIPVSEVLEIPSWLSPDEEPYFLYAPTAIPLSTDEFAVGVGGWAYVAERWWDRYSACGVVVLGPHGEAGRPFELDSGSGLRDWEPWPPMLAPRPGGGFWTVWKVSSCCGYTPLFLDGEEIVSDVPDLCTDWPQIASNTVGRHAVVWLEGACSWSSQDNPRTLVIQTFNAAGRSGQQTRLALGAPLRDTDKPQIGIDRLGRTVVLWPEGTNLYAQRFSPDALPLGPVTLLAEGVADRRGFLGVTSAGSFLVAWNTFSPLLGWEVRLQGWSSAGRREGSGLEIPGPPLVALASDHLGNLALLRENRSSELMLDLFNRDLVRQGSSISVGTSIDDSDWFPDTALALADSGRLLTVWNNGNSARLWQARHEADACVRRGQLFLCDTANDGGAAEARLPLGQGVAEEIPFLADWNGDGRDDPCLYRNGQFFCDTGHDGGTDVRSPTVGTAGDKPLLGDLNGDGKADPCVRRGAAVLCDLARDGGAKDLRIAFGVSSDTVLLGDPDGDGRDDPCLLRSGRLLCDTAHDGNLAEMRLDLRPLAAQGATLLGDVNGDGRDEACRFTGDRFVCGVYPATPAAGGAPTSILEIVFGQPGNVPLLGDLDAF